MRDSDSRNPRVGCVAFAQKGYSEALVANNSVAIVTPDSDRKVQTRHFDLKLSGGQVIVPVAGGDCEVDITFAGTDGAGSSDLLP